MVAQSTKAVSQRRRIAALPETGSRQGLADVSRNTGISSTKKETSTHV